MRNLNAILKPVYFEFFRFWIILVPFLGGNISKRSNTKPNPNKPGRLDQVTVIKKIKITTFF